MKPKSTGTSRTASGKSTGKSKAAFSQKSGSFPYLALCVERGSVRASLQLGKAYKVIEPRENDPVERIRVVDEEGEDYLYLAEWFVPIEVAAGRRKQVLAALAV